MGIKHVVAATAVVAGGLVLTSCGWEGAGGTTFEDSEGIGQTITEVRFTNDSGHVRISSGDSTEVKRIVNYGSDKPGKSYRVDGGSTLVLEECPVRDCRISYEVTVPAGTKVSGHADSGDIEVEGVASANVEAESGNVTVRDVAGDVNASVQSGSVDLSGIGGAVVAGAESGNVSVGLTEAHDVTASASSGNIELTVPDGEYSVQADADSGSVDSDITSQSAAEHKLMLQADSGNITVKRA
jgi:hypothetical protein